MFDQSTPPAQLLFPSFIRGIQIMGCSPTKDQHHGKDIKSDIYMQADLDIESYHFHQFVEDMVKVDGGVQKFLNTLYFEWPIEDPQKYHHLKRYGHTYETWPQTYEQLQGVINRAEERLIDTILGSKLRPVASYFKGAATLKELIGESEATPNEVHPFP